MRKWTRLALLSLCVASVSVPTSALGDEEFIQRLREFVGGLRADYSPTLNFSHEFMISSYFYNLGTDLQLASTVLTQSIGRSRSQAIELASVQARIDLLVDELKAGQAPSQPVLRTFRDAYFGQFESRQIISRLRLIFKDIQKLTQLHSSFCSMENNESAQALFQPNHYYASTVFSVITPPAPNFGGYAQFTFDSQGNLTDADAGPGSGPQQLPPGFTQEEHAIVWGAGALAASLVPASAAGPVGVAVVIVGYAILSGIENKDRVRAIEEQVDLMEEADQIHNSTMAEIERMVPVHIKKYCEAVASDPNIQGPIEQLDSFLEGDEADELISELEGLEVSLSDNAVFLDEWLQDNVGINGNTQLTIEAKAILDGMAAQWEFEEQNAGQFWIENINSKFLEPTGPVISFRSTPEERATALDALTWGDCRYALCYPLSGEEVPGELDPYVSIVWMWYRDQLAGER